MLLILPYLKVLCEWNLPIHEKHTAYMDGQGPCILRAAVGERKTDEVGLGHLSPSAAYGGVRLLVHITNEFHNFFPLLNAL